MDKKNKKGKSKYSFFEDAYGKVSNSLGLSKEDKEAEAKRKRAAQRAKNLKGF